MNKILRTILVAGALCAPALAQHIAVTDLNYGNGNLVKETHGTGAPADACTGLARYTQTDATAGQNIWECINSHMVQQGVSAVDSTARTNAANAQATANAAVPASSKGAANGVASLDGSGQVPVSQLGNASGAATDTTARNAAAAAQTTANAAIPATQKAAANGVATLDGTSKIPIAQIPSIPVSNIASDTTKNGGAVANQAAGGTDVLPANPSTNGVIYTVKAGVATILFPDGSTKTVNVTPLTLQHGGVANGSQGKLNLIGAGSTTVADDGAGNITINSTGGAGGVSMIVPRDLNPHYVIASPASATFNNISTFNGNSGGTTTWTETPDGAGYGSAIITTGTTVNTPVGEALNLAIHGASNPSFKAIFHLSATAGVNAWVGLCSYCQNNLANTAGDVGVNNVAFVGFRHSSSVEATNWTCYASDSTSGAAGTTMDTGVAVNTTQMQLFDVIFVSNVPQFYINGTRVCSSFTATHLPSASVALGATASWQNTTTTAIVGNLYELYFGAN